MTNGNEPAMPFEYNGYEDREPVRKVESGLTKREYFAAMAMQGCIASGFQTSADKHAESAVMFADALIAELNKPTT